MSSEPWVLTFKDGKTIKVIPTGRGPDQLGKWRTRFQAELGGTLELTSPTAGSVTIDGETRTFKISGGPPLRNMLP